MNIRNKKLCFMLLAGLGVTSLLHAQHREKSFQSPPESTRPYTWWHWVNGNVSQEGITKDLAAMKAVGVTHHTFHSACMDVDVGYNIYLPPDYQQAADHRYPVIYFLHGAGGHESKHIFAAEYVQSFISSGQVPPLIIVFVNGGRWTMYLDSRDGTVKSESMIITEEGDVECRPGSYAAVHRVWRNGDVIELDLPMPVQMLVANPRVEQPGRTEDDRLDSAGLTRPPLARPPLELRGPQAVARVCPRCRLLRLHRGNDRVSRHFSPWAGFIRELEGILSLFQKTVTSPIEGEKTL